MGLKDVKQRRTLIEWMGFKDEDLTLPEHDMLTVKCSDKAALSTIIKTAIINANWLSFDLELGEGAMDCKINVFKNAQGSLTAYSCASSYDLPCGCSYPSICDVVKSYHCSYHIRQKDKAEYFERFLEQIKEHGFVPAVYDFHDGIPSLKDGYELVSELREASCVTYVKDMAITEIKTESFLQDGYKEYGFLDIEFTANVGIATKVQVAEDWWWNEYRKDLRSMRGFIEIELGKKTIGALLRRMSYYVGIVKKLQWDAPSYYESDIQKRVILPILITDTPIPDFIAENQRIVRFSVRDVLALKEEKKCE